MRLKLAALALFSSLASAQGTLTDYVCTKGAAIRDDQTGPRPPTSKSPDGNLEAIIQNFNVFLQTPDGKAAALSTDGSESNAYTMRSLAWSPNSRHLVAYKVRPGYYRQVHYIESSPTEQLQPKHTSITYRKPGDALDIAAPTLFNIPDRKQIDIDNALFPNPYSISLPTWRKYSRSFTFEYNQRGYQAYRVIKFIAQTGTPRTLIDETSQTFFYYNLLDSTMSAGRRYRSNINDGKEIIWASERDGWEHLYLYDGPTAFTETNATHSITFSNDHRYFVDTWSRVDLPTVSQLRRSWDNNVLLELEQADSTALLTAGIRYPEVFVAKGRDGKTDIWGTIVRPTNFDPDRKYPVIEQIYAEPQGSFVPKTFGLPSTQALAELSFIVVQIDGMGTSKRSKAFHDIAYKKLGDAGFPDRILWHKAVAAKYPSYDISRVGIYGTSADGQSSLG